MCVTQRMAEIYCLISDFGAPIWLLRKRNPHELRGDTLAYMLPIVDRTFIVQLFCTQVTELLLSLFLYIILHFNGKEMIVLVNNLIKMKIERTKEYATVSTLPLQRNASNHLHSFFLFHY